MPEKKSYEKNCTKCGTIMIVETLGKKVCYDCKLQYRRQRAKDSYKKKQYKCSTCPDNAYNTVDTNGSQCAFCIRNHLRKTQRVL